MMRFAKIKKIAARVAVGALALLSLLSMAASTRAQDAERPYPTMLPLSQYLMDRGAAIALARSAAVYVPAATLAPALNVTSFTRGSDEGTGRSSAIVPLWDGRASRFTRPVSAVRRARR